MSSIQAALSDPPAPDLEATIIERFWLKNIRRGLGRDEVYRSYFRYYATECRRLRLGISKEAWQSTAMVARTHEDILRIVHVLSNEQHLCRPEMRTLLRQHFGEAEDLAINRSIDFAMRVWLTINVREHQFRTHTPRTPIIQWDDSSTLTAFVACNFSHATTTAGSLQLDHTFTAANMHRLSGIDIEWTSCLADHLRFDKRRRLLRIYPFKQILLDHLHVYESSNGDSEKKMSRFVELCGNNGPTRANNIRTVLPQSVLKETLLSLSLLFPHGDATTEDFMLQHDHTFHLEGPFDDSRPHNLADFDHWRNRLLELHQIFHSPPVGWTQIWADRRNPLQWYTFWIAIIILVLTVVFGVISTVVGILQTCLAYESVRLARAQLAAGGGAE